MRYLVISHGPMSKGALESAEMILGAQERAHALSVTVDSTIDSTYDEIVALTAQYPGEEWVVLTDIIGGTPFNASYRFLGTHQNAVIATGFNLPLLIELFMQADLSLEQAISVISAAFPNSMSLVDKVELQTSDEASDFDL